MSNKGQQTIDEQNSRMFLKSTVALGILSLVFFWVSLLAPMIQFAALIQSVYYARRALVPTWPPIIGIGGAVIGFALHITIEFLWII
jgi:hypothetical protein